MIDNFEIITGADAKYFQLCMGLILSVKRRSYPQKIPMTVLDLGLSEEQRAMIKALDVRCIEPGWDYPDLNPSEFPGWFRAMTARPHLPKYARPADILVWIDSDAWVHAWPPIARLITSAENGALSIVEERFGSGVHLRLTEQNGKAREFILTADSVKSNVSSCYRQSFGQEIADWLGSLPSYNSGLFALRSDADTWKIWSKYLGMALKNGFHPLMEQQALNLAIRKNEIEIINHPFHYNFLCTHGLPAFHSDMGKFVSPDGNNEVIGLFHLADIKIFSELPIRQIPEEYFKNLPIRYIERLWDTKP